MTFRCCNHQALAKRFVAHCGVYKVPLSIEHSQCNAPLPINEQSAQRRYSYKEDFPRSAA